MSDKKTITLSKPLKSTNGDPITKLELRAPTFGDIRRHGFPVDGSGQFDPGRAGPLLEALSATQLPILDKMAIKDMMAAMKALGEFFGDQDEETLGN